MKTLAELQTAVEAAYESLDLPSWANPHPGMAEPAEEEYSRVTDPTKYRIVHARARTWLDALADCDEVDVEQLASALLDAAGDLGQFDRGWKLSSQLPGTLPLLLLERDSRSPDRDEPLAVLHISVVRPEVMIASQPDCGCDACDSGSHDLLEAIDRTVAEVIAGPMVVLRGPNWQSHWNPDGASWSRTGRRGPDGDKARRWSRRLAAGEDVPLPRDCEAFIGRSWLD